MSVDTSSKPLPDIPLSLGIQTGLAKERKASDEASNSIQDWWPEALPTFDKDQATSHSRGVLDAASQAHLQKLLKHALYDAQGLALPTVYGSNIFSAIAQALKTLASPQALAGLQHTCRLSSQADAQIQTIASASDVNQTTLLTRLSRLPWTPLRAKDAAANEESQDAVEASSSDDTPEQRVTVAVVTVDTTLVESDLDATPTPSVIIDKLIGASAKIDSKLGGHGKREECAGSQSLSIKWVPNQFKGISLYGSTPEDVEWDEKTEARVERVGGTFLIQCRTTEEATLLTQVVRVGLYTALSMLLETAMLQDLGHRRPSPLPRRELPPPPPILKTPDQSVETQSNDQPMSPSSGSSRWGSKSFWNVFQSKSSGATSSLLGSPRARPSTLASAESKAKKNDATDSASLETPPQSPSKPANRPLRPSGLPQASSDSSAWSALFRQPLDAFASKSELLVQTPSKAISTAVKGPPASTSPETSSELQSLSSRDSAALSLTGLDFLRRFVAQQSLAVLLSERTDPSCAALPAVSSATTSYFKSTTSTILPFTSPDSRPIVPHTGLPSALLQRQETVFYSGNALTLDRQLGQVIEDLFANLKKQPQLLSADVEAGKAHQPPSRIIRYLHGHQQIILSATSQAGRTAIRTEGSSTDDPTDRSQSVSVDGSSSASIEPLWNWSANARTGEQTRPRPVSQELWLLSFSKFIEAVLYHPRLEPDDPENGRNDRVWLFSLGNALIKVHIEPLTVYKLETDGPVVVEGNDVDRSTLKSKKRSRDQEQHAGSEGSAAVQEIEQEVRKFYQSVHKYLERLQQTLDKLGDEKGKAASGGEDLVKTLADLRSAMDSEKHDLRKELRQEERPPLNDIRRALRDNCKTTSSRIRALTSKCYVDATTAPELHVEEPAYAKSGCHPLPGSMYCVREDEPLSIIAFSLSSRDYEVELAADDIAAAHLDFDVPGYRLPNPQGERSTGLPRSASGSYFSVAGTTLASVLRRSEHSAHSDLDAEEWLPEVETYSVTTKRKKRNKESSFLSLTLRKVGSSVVSSAVATPIFENHLSNEQQSFFAPPSNKEDASMSTLEPSSGATVASSAQLPTSNTIKSTESNISYRPEVTKLATPRTPLLASMSSRESLAPSDATLLTSIKSDHSIPASLDALIRKAASPSLGATVGLNTDEVVTHCGSQTPGSPAGLTPVTSASVIRPQSPHIKHTVRQGNLKISCTSWFARDFAVLRQRWGITDSYLESLSRCESWQATGGKSKSTFFKTLDGKWIGKQLLTVWSMDEKEALLEFAPAYLKYMMNAERNDCPSLLVKIAGFYTIKMKHLDGAASSKDSTDFKMSIMVLENVFADEDLERDGSSTGTQMTRFDLKGIRDRRAPKAGKSQPDATTSGEPLPAAVGWDADWIDELHSKAFVTEPDKEYFLQALRNDLAFLQESNVMDFSLLVGILPPSQSSASTRPILRVRLVDYIGAFTLAKQLESSSKKALKSTEAKSMVTILPPHEYAKRFYGAMVGYFIGVPGREGDWQSKLVTRDGNEALLSVLSVL